MDFENDLFISYAHDDDKTAEEGESGWIKRFDKALTTRINTLLRANPSIWRDAKRLRGTDAFADVLDETVTRVCVLVSILSPNYVGSEWCLRELQAFWENAERAGTLKLRNKYRAVKVEKTPFEPEAILPAGRRLLQRFNEEVIGFRFYREEEERASGVQELDPRHPKLLLEFEQKIDDLAYGIKELLQIAKGGPAVGVEKPAVYLAETTSDLEAWREEIQRDLERKGYPVFPDRPLPTQAGKLESLVREGLEQCRISVHPVGKKVGFIPEGAQQSAVELQIALARERAESAEPGFAQLIWIPEGLEAADVEQQQRDRIRKLRDDPGLREGGDLIERSLEELKTQLYERLAALEARKAVVYVGSTNFTLRKQRGAVVAALEQRGHTVLPEWDLPPLLASDLEPRVARSLAKSHVSLHLVGPDYGVVPEGTDRSVARLEYELAVEKQAEGARRLVVFPPGLQAADDRQRGFIEELRRDTAATAIEIPPEDLDALQRAVAEQVEAAEKRLATPAKPEKPAAAAPGPVRVYVISDQGDQGDEQLAKLTALLRERRYEVLTPFFGADDEDDWQEEHEENLEDCDAVVVYHGAASERWQRRRLRELRRRPELPRHARAFLLAPPRTGPKEGFDTEEATVIDATQGLDPALLEPFLSDLEQGERPPAG